MPFHQERGEWELEVKAELESAVLTAMQALAPGSFLEAEESGMGWFVAGLSLTEETRVLPRLQVPA